MKGWECPKCGAVMAPWVEECEHCKPVLPVVLSPWIQWGTPTPDPPYKITCTPHEHGSSVWYDANPPTLPRQTWI